MKTTFASLLLLLATSSAVAEQTIDYRFDEIKRKVTLTTAKEQLQVEKGSRAVSGDKVSTGWFSYALIASERYRAKFEIFASTDVQLAGNAPGVILSLERGRLRAMFDKITGNEPRVVQTPGALLAVRGTQYEITVDATGQTELSVYEGIVEVRSELRPAPLLVHAGEAASFSRKDPPISHQMPRDGNAPGRDGRDGRGDPHGGDPNHMPQQPPGGHGMMPPPPPPPPSGKPGGH
jgi:hypothetical protein